MDEVDANTGADVRETVAPSGPVAVPKAPRGEALTIVNASDDFKIDSLRKNPSYLLALSEGRGIASKNEIIVEPPPDYPAASGQGAADPDVPDRQPGEEPTRKRSESGQTRKTDSRRGDCETSADGPRAGSRRRTKPTSGAGEENPAFHGEGGPSRADRSSVPDFRKRVSWNETVICSSEEKTDIILTGLHEEESDTDDLDIDERRYATARTSALGTILEDQPSPRNRNPDERTWRRRSGRDPRESSRSQYKCPLCTAVVLIALAVVGIVVLATMYGVRYATEKTTAQIIRDITQTFSLLPSEAGSVFLFTLYRPPSDQAQDGATYFLLEKDSVMPWQSPEGAASFVWLQGEPVLVQVLDRRGRLFSRLLGDPVGVRGAQYTLSMASTDWYAAKLYRPNSYALLAMSQDRKQRGWLYGNVTELLNTVALWDMRDKILEFSIPKRASLTR